MNKKHHDFGVLFWLHFLLIITFWLLPFLVNIKLVVVSCVFYYAQRVILGPCILTKMQFQDHALDTGFYYYYITRLGFKINKEKLDFFVEILLPWVILFITLIWQFIFQMKPILI